LHLAGNLLQVPIAREQNKGRTIRFFYEMRDPVLQLLCITGVAWIGHFPHHEHFHLFLKIERAAKLQRLGFGRADAFAEIGKILASHGKGRAGHYTAGIIAEQHSTKVRSQVDRRGIKREELGGFSGALDPVNVLRRALLQKNGVAFARVSYPPGEFLQLCFYNFVIRAFHHLGDSGLKSDQSPGNSVGNEIDISNPELAPFPEIAGRFDRIKKLLCVVDQFGGKAHTRRVPHHREKSFFGSGVVEALNGGSQPVLRNADADLLRRDLFDGVRFVEDDEIVGEKKTTLTALLFVRRTEQHEKQGVIEDNDVGGQ